MEELAVTLSCAKLSGQFNKKIRVTTNDPAHAKQELVCKGQILEPILLKPKRINFGQISRTTPPAPKKILITPGDAEGFAPKLLPVDTPGLTAVLREVEPGKRFELEVAVQPPFTSNRLRANLKLQTGVSEAPIASIPVYASVSPRVHAMPRRVMIPNPRNADWHQIVRLVWDEGLDYKILEATSTDPGLQLEIIENEGKQEVKLTVAPDYEPGPSMRTVDIKTDDPEQPELKVSVAVRRQPPARGSERATTRPKRIPTTAKPIIPAAPGAKTDKMDASGQGNSAPPSKPAEPTEIPDE